MDTTFNKLPVLAEFQFPSSQSDSVFLKTGPTTYVYAELDDSPLFRVKVSTIKVIPLTS